MVDCPTQPVPCPWNGPLVEMEVGVSVRLLSKYDTTISLPRIERKTTNTHTHTQVSLHRTETTMH